MFSLKVESRQVGAQSNNSLRKTGFLPAVYFHKGEDSVALKVSVQELAKALASHEAVIKLSNHKMAVVKEVQRDPVSNKIIHVSLQGVVAGEKFHKTVPVVCTHEEGCSWEKLGMSLTQSLKEIEIETTPENVPEAIRIDVSDLQKGQVLRVKDIEVPKGVRIVDEEETQIAHVHFPHVEAEEEPEATTTEATAPTTEATTKKDE